MTTKTFVSASLAIAMGCGGGGSEGNLFEEKPECTGEAITAYAGTQPQVISKLEIGAAADGFDLDGDGKPDNKLAAVSSVAKSAIDDSLANYDIVIPIEFFDLAAAAKDQCVKFAIYLGDYVNDTDNDGKKPFIDKGDCNDKEMSIRPGNPEVPNNFVDDNCNGLADEDGQNTPSSDTMDRDGDGQSIMAGDCDDRPGVGAMSKKGGTEICGDGLDNDCDGVADRTGTTDTCSPFNAAADITLDPLSFAGGAPVISFKEGTISEVKGKLELLAGPSIFSVNIPVTDGITLDLRITGAQIKADVVDEGGHIILKNGKLGGVIDSKTADTIRGLDVEQIGLLPENSLLDATYANLLGPLLALPKAKDAQEKYPGCRTPDIDVDQDGLEAFCDTNPDDDVKVVDVCIDGDGTEIKDAGGMQCSEAMKDGKYRFLDGISVELNFETTAIKSIKPPR
jgi:hypothetical protein